MTDIPTPEPRTWDVEDPDITPGEYLVGLCKRRWTGDEESKAYAIGVLLTETFMAAGMPLEEAAEVAERQIERGVTVGLTEGGLHFEFGDPDEEEADEEAETAPDDDPNAYDAARRAYDAARRAYDAARRAYDAAIESGLTHDEAVEAAWPEGPEGP